MINVCTIPKGSAGHTLASSHVYTFTPVIMKEDGELRLQFTNLCDDGLSSAFNFLFNTSGDLQMSQ